MVNTTFPSTYIHHLLKADWPLDTKLLQKKIFAVALFALSFLTALYLVRKYYLRCTISRHKNAEIGTEVIINDSLNRLNKLTNLPPDIIIETSSGRFQHPQVTMTSLNNSLEVFTRKWNYAGVSFSMKTNQIYGKTIPNVLFTAIYFRKQDHSLYNSFKNFFNLKLHQTKNFEIQKKELEELVFPLINGWQYESMQIGNVNGEFFSDKQTKSDYELYLLLFYKNIESI